MTPGCRPGTAAAGGRGRSAVAIALAAARHRADGRRRGTPASRRAAPRPARARLVPRASCAPLEEAPRRLARAPRRAHVGAARGERARRRRVRARARSFSRGWLTILAGTLDILDGGVARRAGTAGPRGALVDSLVDRYAEFATFVGLGAFFRDGWMLLAVVLAAFGSLMVSYTRARAEGLGLEMSQGSVQRPERYVRARLGRLRSRASSPTLACGAGRASDARRARGCDRGPRGRLPLDGASSAPAWRPGRWPSGSRDESPAGGSARSASSS